MTILVRWLIILVLFALVLTWNYHVSAAALSPKGCSTLALISLEVVWAKEVGADKEKVLASLVKEVAEDKTGVTALVISNFEKLWKTQAGYMEVGQWTFQDCIDRRGIYPEAV